MDCALLVGLEEHEEGVALARGVGLGLEHLLHQLWPIGEQVLEGLVDGGYGEHSVPAHKCVPVLKVALHHGDERLEDFGLLELAHQAKRAPADPLVRVIEVVSEEVRHEDHLWQHLAIGSVLLHHLVVHEKQLLNLVVVARDAEANNRHEQFGHGLPGQQERDELLQAPYLLFGILGL